MTQRTDEASSVLAPSSGASAPRSADRLAGTGTAEDSNSTKLTQGAMATLIVGDVAVRATWSGTTAASTQVATTDLIIPANGRFDWLVEDGTSVVYVEAADGSSAYECWVWTSGPGTG